MKVEIKLKDKNYCDECPLLIHGLAEEWGWVKCDFTEESLTSDNRGNVKRPRDCIKKHGE